MTDWNNPPKEAKEAAARSWSPKSVSGTLPEEPPRPYAQQSPVYNPDDSEPDTTNGTNAAIGTNGTNGRNANNAANANNATNPTVAPYITPSDTTNSDGIGPADDPGCGIDPTRMPVDFRRFDKVIPVLIQPDSAVSERFPLLHRVIAGRLKTSLDLRGGRRVSRCPHAYRLGPRSLKHTEKYRPDSHAFQKNVVSSPRQTRSGSGDETDNARLGGICRKLRRRVRLSGLIGSGGYGTVFLAYKNTPHGQANFAIKVFEHVTVKTIEDRRNNREPEMMFFDEGARVRYIPCEAMIMLLLTRSPRFPTLHNVYTDKDKVALVMSACIDYDTLQNSPRRAETHKVWAVEGSLLRTHKVPKLNELEACKVSTQLLEAIAYLRDMNLTYDDLSFRNYLVGENLDTQLIDFGIMGFGLVDDDFLDNAHAYLFWQEYQLLPEIAIELLKPQLRNEVRNETNGHVKVKCRRDTRQASLWKYAVEVFSLLHGHAPWEDPEYNPAIGVIGNFACKKNIDGVWEEPPNIYDQGPRWDAAYARRKRMINEELAVREDLSLDCVDVLRAMLERDPEQRPRLSELISFPWFGQWAYHSDRLFERPPIPRDDYR